MKPGELVRHVMGRRWKVAGSRCKRCNRVLLHDVQEQYWPVEGVAVTEGMDVLGFSLWWIENGPANAVDCIPVPGYGD